MKPSIYRRIRRRTATEAATSKKENKQESSFFGEAASKHFFQPAAVITQAPVINRKCAECEQEDKNVQRAADKKEEDKKLQRMTDKKEEEKLQRQPEKKEEEKLMKKGDEKKEEKIQKKEAGNPTSTPVTSSYISSLNSKGTPLPKQSQQFFGSRMGYDFSHVKVHTDQEAARSAKEVNAKAYTTGEHIVFNEGQYDTDSAEGKKLMAHELAHVMQQSGSMQMLQRIACDETVSAPPRAAQGTRNSIDARAQAIIDIASGTDSASAKAIAIVTQIICKYYPSDAAIVNSVTYNASLTGLDTTSVGSGATTTGIIGVGDSFVSGVTAAHFARRVLQVGHEIQHIQQYRAGLAGANNANEREFLAFAENALADEFEGTGRMTNGTRLNIVDAAIGYYHCLTDALKTRYQSRFTALQARRTAILETGRVRSPGAEPTSCVRASN